VFSRRCTELGFNFAVMSDAGFAGLVVGSFKPELMVCWPGRKGELPAAFTSSATEGCTRRYVVRVGLSMPGANFPEFAPIWLGHEWSRASLLDAVFEAEVAAIAIPVAPNETAMSLRQKHAEAVARLVVSVLDGEGKLAGVQAGVPQVPVTSVAAEAPKFINIQWDDSTVDRFIRARRLPPLELAVVADPVREEDMYFIETMEQYRQFRYGADAGTRPRPTWASGWRCGCGDAL